MTEVILQALKGGDRARAIRHCLTAYQVPIGRFCMSLVGHREEADSLALSTFATAFRGEETFSGQSTVRAFLFGTARRLCVHHLEKNTRRRRRPGGRDNSAQPSSASEAARMNLDLLKPTEREVLLLCVAFELSTAEAAYAAGLRPAVVEERLRQGLERLVAAQGGER
jgi:RNA polymerase sigma-70 factor (ECF subfamily)